MKKTISLIAILLLVLVSCKHGNINGGRYYGTFNNLANNMREAGSISYTYDNQEGNVYFLMNDLVSMSQVAENKFAGAASGAILEDLLETMPAIDSIKVCDSTQTIQSLSVDAEFMGNSVKTNLVFTNSDQGTVNVEFIGYYE